MALPHSVVGVDGVSLVESSTNRSPARGAGLLVLPVLVELRLVGGGCGTWGRRW